MNTISEETIKEVVYTYRAKDVMFGFDEEIEITDEHIKVSGYTYFTYNISSQMYIPDVDQVYNSLEENNLLESRKKKALELFEDDSKENIASANDWFDYMQRAKSIKGMLDTNEYATVEINEGDDIFVDIIIKIPLSDKVETILDRCMDDVHEAIVCGKY